VISYFLAAGASEPFGYPVTKRFQEILANELVNKFGSNPDLIRSELRVLLTILKHEAYPDVEYIFEFQKQLSRMIQLCPLVVDFFKSYTLAGTIKGVPTAAHEQGVDTKNYFEYNDYLVDFVGSKIYEYYSWQEHNIENIQKVYSKLFHLGNQDNIDIFTTNYDTVVKEYSKESSQYQYHLIDGFEYDHKSRSQIWNQSKFNENTGSDTSIISIFKLHGSLNWKRHRKYGIVKLEDVEKMMKNDGQYTEDLLIKPTLSPKEEEQEEPFKTLFDKFRERIVKSKICIVVGYSFRDQGINEIFDMFMKQGGRLIIISPDVTKEFEENFIEKYHPIQKGYTLLDDKVTVDGIDLLVDKIKPHLS
jgi:hypothetical protein